MNGFFAGFALALLLWFFAFLYLKFFVRRRTSPDHILGLLQEEVRQLEADIDEKTEQNLQLLEEKIRSLREICEEAERRIVVYNHELEKREKETQTLAALNMPPLLEKIELPDSSKAAIMAYRNQTRQQAPAADVQKNQTAESPPAIMVPSATAVLPKTTDIPIINFSREPLTTKKPPIKERIAELHRAGFSPELIAKRLGIKLGEVEFYFNLAEKPED